MSNFALLPALYFNFALVGNANESWKRHQGCSAAIFVNSSRLLRSVLEHVGPASVWSAKKDVVRKFVYYRSVGL